MQVVTRARADVSLRDVTIAQDELKWQGASDVTHRKCMEDLGDFEESQRVENYTPNEEVRLLGSTNLRAVGALRDEGQMNKTA